MGRGDWLRLSLQTAFATYRQALILAVMLATKSSTLSAGSVWNEQSSGAEPTFGFGGFSREHRQWRRQWRMLGRGKITAQVHSLS